AACDAGWCGHAGADHRSPHATARSSRASLPDTEHVTQTGALTASVDTAVRQGRTLQLTQMFLPCWPPCARTLSCRQRAPAAKVLFPLMGALPPEGRGLRRRARSVVAKVPPHSFVKCSLSNPNAAPTALVRT